MQFSRNIIIEALLGGGRLGYLLNVPASWNVRDLRSMSFHLGKSGLDGSAFKAGFPHTVGVRGVFSSLPLATGRFWRRRGATLTLLALDWHRARNGLG